MGIQNCGLYVLANAEAFCDLKIFSEIKKRRKKTKEVFWVNFHKLLK